MDAKRPRDPADVVDHKGRRKAKRVGSGPQGKKAADLAATKIQARLAEGDTSGLDASHTGSPLAFEKYAEQWRQTHASQACKFSTSRIYEVNLRLHVFPVLGTKAVSMISRADCRTLIAASRDKGLSPKLESTVERF